MEKYNGNKEPFIYALFDDEDTEAVLPILEKIDSQGYKLDYEDARYEKAIDKAALILLFISKRALEDPKVLEVVSYASKQNKTVVTIYLEEAELTPGLSMMLGQTQGILKYNLDETAFNEKLFASPALTNMQITEGQKKAAKNTSIMLTAAAVLIVALAGMFIYFNQYSPIDPNSLLGKLGVSGNLNSINELYVYGEEIRDDYSIPNYIISDDGLNDLIIIDPETIYDIGSLNDLSDFGELKNIKRLCLCGNQIESIEDLLKLKHLEFLDLSHNYSLDITGIDQLTSLKELNLAYTEIEDYSILLNMPKLKLVYVSADMLPTFEKMANKQFEVRCVNTPIYTLQDLKDAVKDEDVFNMCIMNNLTIPEGEVIDIPKNKILSGTSLYVANGDLNIYNYGTINLYGSWEMGLCQRYNYGTINIKNGGIYTGGMCDTRTSGRFIIEEGGLQIVERGHSFFIDDGLYQNNGRVVLQGGGEYYFNNGEYINNGLIQYYRGDFGVMINFNNDNYINNGTIQLNDSTISMEDFATNYRNFQN